MISHLTENSTDYISDIIQSTIQQIQIAKAVQNLMLLFYELINEKTHEKGK